MLFRSTYALSVGLSGSGTGSVTSTPGGINCGSTCSASFSSGATVTLSAAPAAGSTFQGWSGACSDTGVCTVTLSYNQSVTASFSAGPQPTVSMYCGTYSGRAAVRGDTLSGNFTVRVFSDGAITGTSSNASGPDQPFSGRTSGSSFTATVSDGTQLSGSYQPDSVSGTFVNNDPQVGSSGTFSGTRCY